MHKLNGFAPELSNVRIVDFSPVGEKYIKVFADVLGVEQGRKVGADDEWLWREADETDREQVARKIAAKVFKDNLMDKDFVLKAINVKLDMCDKLDIRRYFSEIADMNLLNPHFGYPAGSNNTGLHSRGVFHVWAKDKAEYISVEVRPHGYGGSEQRLYPNQMNAAQLRGIWGLVDYKCRQREMELNKAANNKSIEEYAPELETWAKNCLESVQHMFAVQLKTGKRAYDSQEYKALVFYQNEGGPCNANSQIGHVAIWQDSKGFICYNERKPLCGETPQAVLDMQNPEIWKKQLQESVEYMVGCKLVVREKTEQEKRISDICVYRRTCGGKMTADYMLRCKIDGVQQSGRLVGKESTQLHNLISDRQEGYLAKLKLELAQKYFKDVLDHPQTREVGIKR